jgi:hypothetical protein
MKTCDIFVREAKNVKFHLLKILNTMDSKSIFAASTMLKLKGTVWLESTIVVYMPRLGVVTQARCMF